MINKNPYLIGQQTLDLLIRIEMDAIFAEDVLEENVAINIYGGTTNNDHGSAEQFGRYKLMVELGRELYEAIDADLLAADVDPQLG